ncbi:MAG: hypothetical protein U1F16_18800 [Turneriella sp.]
MLTKVIATAFAFGLFACAQSTIVLDPVTNKAAAASTAPTQGTVTVNVNIPTHTNRPFTVLLYQNGTLMAGLAIGSASTDASGVASVQLLSPDTNNCLVGAAATLPNGTYQLYFAIRAIGDMVISTANAGACGNGYLQYSDVDTSFRHHRSNLTVNGNTTYNITTSNTSLGMVHKFLFDATGFAGAQYRCYVVDTNVTGITATTQPIALYVGTLSSGTGCTTGDGASTTIVSGICTPTAGVTQSYLPAVGSYKYFCYVNTNGGSFLETGEKLAAGTMNVTGANTTYFNASSFTTVPP